MGLSSNGLRATSTFRGCRVSRATFFTSDSRNVRVVFQRIKGRSDGRERVDMFWRDVREDGERRRQTAPLSFSFTRSRLHHVAHPFPGLLIMKNRPHLLPLFFFFSPRATTELRRTTRSCILGNGTAGRAWVWRETTRVECR